MSINWDVIRDQQRAEDKFRAHAKLVAFIERWSPTSREDAARFSAELYQIAQTMQREQYELLRPVLEDFLANRAFSPFFIKEGQCKP